MSKFIGATVGLECNGHGLVGKMVKIEYSKAESGGVVLNTVSGRNLASMKGCATVTAEQFSNRPDTNIAEARWALNLCGWAPMGDCFDCADGSDD